MIDAEVRVQIRRYFYAEHWKVGTIAQALGVHPDTVKRAIEVERFHRAEQLRSSMLDAYLPFLRQTLEAYPRLRATRLHQMLQDRGYRGSVEQLRRVVARLRPRPQEAFLRLHVFAGEQSQVDWALCRARHSWKNAEFSTMPSRSHLARWFVFQPLLKRTFLWGPLK